MTDEIDELFGGQSPEDIKAFEEGWRAFDTKLGLRNPHPHYTAKFRSWAQGYAESRAFHQAVAEKQQKGGA